MTVSPEDDFAAAEYRARHARAPSERATLAARRLREPELDEAIRAWEERSRRSPKPRRRSSRRAIFSPRSRRAFGRRLRPRPRRLRMLRLSRCSAASRAGAPGDRRVGSRRRCWRSASSRARRRGEPRRVNMSRSCRRTPTSPAIEVTVDLDKRELRVRPVAAKAPPGKAYELWIIDAKLGAPRSLGVIGEGTRAAQSRPATIPRWSRARPMP